MEFLTNQEICIATRNQLLNIYAHNDEPKKILKTVADKLAERSYHPFIGQTT